jgi:hypothetical protein
VQEHKAVCHSLLDLLAASHSEELTQVFWIQRVAVASVCLSTQQPFCSGPQAHKYGVYTRTGYAQAT